MARTIGIGIGIPYPGAQGAGGASAAQAVRFDGINDFYEIASTGPAGVADGPDATFGFWFKMEGGDGTAQTIFEIGTTTAHRLEVVRLADNTLRVISRTSAAADIAQHVSASTFVVADGWNHALVDLNDTASIMRINGVAEGTNTPGSSGDIDLTNQYSIGHSDDPAAAELFDGCLADFWFVDESLGLTDDIAEQFYDTTLDAPRDLGTNGTGPSANVLIYLNRADPNFHLNLAGTDFVETGAVDSCTGPGNYSAQHFPGYVAGGVNFDGLTLGNSATNTFAADSGVAVYSFWHKPGQIAGADVWAVWGQARCFIKRDVQSGGRNNAIAIQFLSDVSLDFRARGSTPIVDTSKWYHILLRVRNDAVVGGGVGSAAMEMYVDDVAETVTITANDILSDLFELALPSTIGGRAEVDNCDGGLSDFFGTSENIDITIEANRRLFTDALGNPLDPGVDGSNFSPTATAPEIMDRGNAGDFYTNIGSGPDFDGSTVGTLTTVAGPP